MKNKTVKEKVEEIIKKQTLAIICKECNGGGYNYDKKENCEECEGTGLSEWRFGAAIEDIDKLYRKEMIKIVEGNKLPDPNPYGEYVKIKNVNLILDKVKWECEVKYHALPERRKIKSTYEENRMPPTILDDDIANWEHDNLVENG